MVRAHGGKGAWNKALSLYVLDPCCAKAGVMWTWGHVYTMINVYIYTSFVSGDECSKLTLRSLLIHTPYSIHL